MTKQDFINWAKSRSWKEDKYGHLQKTIGDRKYRFKIGSTAIRYEVQVHHASTQYSKAENEWMRLRSGYLKSLYIAENGKLSGLK